MKYARTCLARAFSLVELFLVVAVIGVLAGLLLPKWVRRQRQYAYYSCLNNQKQIALAFKVWALDNNDLFPMQVSVTNGGTRELVSAGNVWPHFEVMSNELSTPKILFCPQETGPGRKTATAFRTGLPGAVPGLLLTNDLQVSYFIALDANSTNTPSWLVGDHNLSITGKPVPHGLLNVWSNAPLAWNKPRPSHSGAGFITLSDGSVSPVKNLRGSLFDSGRATNLLAMP